MRLRWIGWALAAAILWAPTARAQASAANEEKKQSGENPFYQPEMRKYWNPLVGVGEVYEVTGADGTKRTEEYDIVSEETIEGKKAYWLGIIFGAPSLSGKVYAKALVTPADFRAHKVIGQLPGMAAMEMPVGAAVVVPKTDPKDAPKLVGTDSVTVPAGTFECEHYRNSDGSEVWLSAKVGPMKVVKSSSANGSRELVRTVSHPKDGITGPVKAYDPDAIKNFRESQNQ